MQRFISRLDKMLSTPIYWQLSLPRAFPWFNCALMLRRNLVLMRRFIFMLGFVHIQKTAGTSVKFILRNSTYLKHCDIMPKEPYGIVSDKDLKLAKNVFFFGLNTISGHGLINPTDNISEPIQYFTFIRDPLQRCASHYQHIKRASNRRGKDINFEEYIRDEEKRDFQVRKIAGGPDLEKAKDTLREKFLFVGLTERFAESMVVFQHLCPYKINLQYTRLHVAKDITAKKEVLENPVTRRLLEESNALDLELYEYVRDIIYPAQLEKAGLADLKVDEKDHHQDSYPFRYKLTRGYNNAVYKSLIKLRRYFSR